MSRLRYLVPNGLTCTAIAFGLLAIQSAILGHHYTGIWWTLYCVLFDKLDGFAARRLNAQSKFGMQMDSLADFLSFGIAPGTVFYAFFSSHPELGWSTGFTLWALRAIVIFYVACAATRLARFNVTADLPGAEKLFFGTPTTFAGGILATSFAALLKYGDPSWVDHMPPFDVHLFGHVRLDGAMRWFPFAVLLGGVGMVSHLRVPKLGLGRSKLVNAYLVVNVVVAYFVGMFRIVPEYLALGGLSYLVGSLWFHATDEKARALKLPPLFE